MDFQQNLSEQIPKLGSLVNINLESATGPWCVNQNLKNKDFNYFTMYAVAE